MLKERLSKKEIAELMNGTPTSGTVEVQLINPKRTGSITLRDYYMEDEFGSRLYRPFVDSNGNEKVAKYTKKKVLNLTNENDRLEFAHLKEHPIYVKSANPVIKLVNFDEEADTFVKMKDAAAEADGIIRKFEGEKLHDLARVLQIKVRPGSSDIVLKRALYEYAETKLSSGSSRTGALEIIEQINNPDYFRKCSIYRALEKKVIQVTNGRYLFGQVGMGTTFDTALQFLKDNPDLESELNKKLNFAAIGK